MHMLTALVKATRSRFLLELADLPVAVLGNPSGAGSMASCSCGHPKKCWAVNTGHAANRTFLKNADPGSKQAPPKCGAWVQGQGLCRGSSAARKPPGVKVKN